MNREFEFSMVPLAFSAKYEYEVGQRGPLLYLEARGR